MTEIFEDVKGYEDLYQVSNLGRVFSKRRIVGNNTLLYGKELRPFIDDEGYLKIILYKDGERHTTSVHRLVAQAFIENVNNLPQVNHKDGNKFNNVPSNLEWCTKEYNIQHAKINNLMQHGEKRPSSKLTEKQVITIYKLKDTMSCVDLAKQFGVAANTIRLIKLGKKWQYLYKQYFNIETGERLDNQQPAS